MGIQIQSRSITCCRVCGKRQEIPSFAAGPDRYTWPCVRPICSEPITIYRQTGLTQHGPIEVWMQAGEQPPLQAVSDDCAPLPPEQA